MSLHPQAEDFLERVAAVNRPRLTELPVTEARRALTERRTLQGPVESIAEVRETLVQGADGMLPARVYRPHTEVTPPMVVYFHGGGWVLGDLDHADRSCRRLTKASGCVVVSVAYRLSPETKFPGPLEDCYHATLWAAENAVELGGDPDRLAVAGDSAGGALAAGVTLLARDRRGPVISQQTLLYPSLVAEHIRPAATETDGTPFASYALYGSGYNLTRRDMEWYWGHYLAAPEQAMDGYAAPLRAKDLSNLPPAFVLVPGCDPLRDEGLAYAERLVQAGVPALTRVYEGQLHALIWLAGVIDDGVRAIEDAGEHLKTFFNGTRNINAHQPALDPDVQPMTQSR